MSTVCCKNKGRFCFPKAREKSWLQAIGLKTVPKFSKLCEYHFAEQDILHLSTRSVLRDNALPSKTTRPLPDSPQLEQNKTKVKKKSKVEKATKAKGDLKTNFNNNSFKRAHVEELSLASHETYDSTNEVVIDLTDDDNNPCISNNIVDLTSDNEIDERDLFFLNYGTFDGVNYIIVWNNEDLMYHSDVSKDSQKVKLFLKDLMEKANFLKLFKGTGKLFICPHCLVILPNMENGRNHAFNSHQNILYLFVAECSN